MSRNRTKSRRGRVREVVAKASNCPTSSPSSLGVWAAIVIIVLATVAAFSNSFAGVLTFDDENAITENPTIRCLWPISIPLCPPQHGETVTGRPLLNLSLAVNYAISGLDVWSYHAVNLVIHLAAALLLFGLLRRTLELPIMRDRWAAAAAPLSLAIALLWAVHPLQTESVTYVVQRAESLVGLFYLLTLYALVRGATTPRPMVWYAVSGIACACGMASKEVMVSAPLIAILYDRTFLTGSFRDAWHQRHRLYLAMAATWLLLAWLVITAGGRGGTAGFGQGIDPWAYLGTQCGAIVHYLRLTVWPYPLVLDYGTGLARGAAEIIPYAIIVVLLGLVTLTAICRWPRIGFLGACFFALLAPTSSIVPVVTQTVAEHRMYLPLAAVIAAIVLSGYWLAMRHLQRLPVDHRRAMFFRRVAVGLVGVVAVALGCVSFLRNRDYRSEYSIWKNTLERCPENQRAHCSLAGVLIQSGQFDEGIKYCKSALDLKPDYPDALVVLGVGLSQRGQADEAISCFKKAIQLRPDFAEAYSDYGQTLADRGQTAQALPYYEKALKLNPNLIRARNNYGRALAALRQFDKAIDQYRLALGIDRGSAEAHNNWGMALVGSGRVGEAMSHFQQAVQLNPKQVEAQNNLGMALLSRQRLDEATSCFRKALEIKPNCVEAYNNLAIVAAKRGHFAEAVDFLQKALKINPQDAQARKNLDQIQSIKKRSR